MDFTNEETDCDCEKNQNEGLHDLLTPPSLKLVFREQDPALRPEDVSPSLSVGISVDRLITAFLPILGGLAWYNGGPGGYRYVFFGGAPIALLNLISARRIKVASVPSLVASKKLAAGS